MNIILFLHRSHQARHQATEQMGRQLGDCIQQETQMKDGKDIDITCLCTVLQMNCAMIRFVILLTSGDSEYVYVYVDCM